ncbi:uncharacterized protein F54H12.2-like [Oppia nitens]|uniref:uncharacterized protein F54H12.2-like n=1 Tax=Oppia nitens TaxID=1686743 RepID=UPI0023DA00CA|nr:uncharacterized protein F54H12.2-like [Oppia nitens]
MTTIHPLSSLMTLPELDIFGVPPTQLMIEKDIQTDHRPLTTIKADSPIEFEITTGINEYINLNKSELYLYVKIGQTTITSSSINYPYIAYFDALLNTSSQSKSTHMQTSMWVKDSYPFNDHNLERQKRLSPKGKKLAVSRHIELYGKLHLDLSQQLKSLIGGVTINIKIHPNSPDFYLMYDKSIVPKVNIIDTRLYIHRSIVHSQVVLAHNKMLEEDKPALYFITRREVKTCTIPKDSIDYCLNNVESGVLPRKLYISFVSNDAYNGSQTLNQFYFKHYSLRYIACYLNGQQYPHKPYTPDFQNDKYIREYFSLFEVSNQLSHTTCDITKDEFAEGFSIFAFNFIPDLSDGVAKSGYVSPLQRGGLRIELKFNYPLAEQITALIYCEYDSLIEIQKNRFAVKDFS